MHSCDVLVVGAGPAGCAVARDIAAAGADVLVLERRREIGEPCLCSGLVSPRTLEVAGVDQTIVRNSLRGAEVHTAGGGRLALRGRRVRGLVIDRAGLDQALAEQARGAGATIETGWRVQAVTIDSNAAVIQADSDSGSLSVRCQMVVGADGVASVVGRDLCPDGVEPFVNAVGGEGELSGLPSDRAHVFLGSKVAPGWFGWLIPAGEGRVRFGTGSGNGSHVSPKKLLANLMAAFPSQFADLRADRVWSKQIPVYAPRVTYGDRFMLVGDAARQVKATSGGGLYTGLVCARHCASTALDALRQGRFDSGMLAGYEAAWKAELGQEFERCLDLRRTLTGLSDSDLDRLLRLISSPPLRGLITLLGDIDYPSLLVERMLRATPMLRGFAKTALRFPWRWPQDILTAVDSAQSVGPGQRTTGV